MKVYGIYGGRLGNVIFRHYAFIILHILYGAEFAGYSSDKGLPFKDPNFRDLTNCINSGTHYYLDPNWDFRLEGYFQHDKIYHKYKNEIINYIKTHPEEKLITEKFESYNLIQLLEHDNIKKYKIVVHIRLEDYMEASWVINPECYKNILDKYSDEQICFVLAKPTEEIEKKYMEYFSKLYKNIVIESNDVITDYHIMKNAEILVSSLSTLCWSSTFFSTTQTKVYFPKHNIHGLHNTFNNPHSNTEYYDTELCSKSDLEKILN